MIDKWNHGAIVLDFETRSRVDLQKSNPYNYSRHDSTTALCCAYKIIEAAKGPLKIHKTRIWKEDDLFCPDDLEWAIENGFLVWAHNVFFERCIFENVMVPKFDWPKPKVENYRCSSAQAAAMAFPKALFDVGKALRLHTQKDDKGHRIMLQLCKPRKPSKNNPDKWYTKEKYPDKYKALYKYCINDVKAEYAVIKALPYLNTTEFKLWQLDQQINMRGIYCDRTTVKNTLALFGRIQEQAKADISRLTKEAVTTPNQIARIKEWCATKGVELDSLDANSVEQALDGKIPKPVRKVLAIRQLMGKASVRKYQAMLNLTSDDSRIRSHLVYAGARRTARWSGSGIQPQNMPRGNIKSQTDIEWCIERINAQDIESLDLVYDSVTDVFSSLVRPMLTAAPDHKLIAGDFASIEARVLFWLAKDTKALKVFRNVDKDPEKYPDIYMVQAGNIYGINPMDAYKGSEERYLGKKSILGLGYGMGWKKFRDTVKDESGIELTAAFAKKVVKNYRKRWKSVPGLWTRFEDAAIRAIQNQSSVKVGAITYSYEKGYLFCTLPSKRRIAYYKPRLTEDVTPWGSEVFKLSYMGLDSQSYKWKRIHTYGGKLVENAVQAIARDLMAFAMLRLERSNYKIVLTVHDEIVCEVPSTVGSDDTFRAIMEHNPSWAKGLPTQAESWIGKRYRK